MTSNKSQKKKVLILCAGFRTRWNNYLGIPKQLISINGESLLERMTRLLRAHGYFNIDIIARDERMHLSNCGFFTPQKYRWTVETLLSTQSLWEDKTLVLLGDVFYTEKAIKTIIKQKEGIHIYGRPRASMYTLNQHGEIFAISFDRNSWNKIISHAEIVRSYAKLGGRGKIWELYRSLAGFSLDKHKIENNIFIQIHDFTDDFDSPDEYNRVIRRYEYITSNSPYKIILIYSWIFILYPFRYLILFIKRITNFTRNNCFKIDE